jgi:hypothetical protein
MAKILNGGCDLSHYSQQTQANRGRMWDRMGQFQLVLLASGTASFGYFFRLCTKNNNFRVF